MGLLGHRLGLPPRSSEQTGQWGSCSGANAAPDGRKMARGALAAESAAAETRKAPVRLMGGERSPRRPEPCREEGCVPSRHTQLSGPHAHGRTCCKVAGLSPPTAEHAQHPEMRMDPFVGTTCASGPLAGGATG